MAEPLDRAEGLRADLKALTARISALQEEVEALRQPADASKAADEAGEENGFPPFILLLDPPEHTGELEALIAWVDGVLIPCYLDEPSAEARWCHRWPEHPVAVARLHALWLAWQELTDPAVCGYTGPSIWHRDHLRPCLDELRSGRGPFRGCTKGEHQVTHREPGRVPSTAFQDPGAGAPRPRGAAR
jgi:hypothetical protein